MTRQGLVVSLMTGAAWLCSAQPASQLPRPYAEARSFMDLGAGFDSRAYRFRESRLGLKLFEDIGMKELTQRYLIGVDGKPDGRMTEGHRILEARVP